MLDSIYHMKLRLFKNRNFGVKMPPFMQRYNGRRYVTLLNL